MLLFLCMYMKLKIQTHLTLLAVITILSGCVGTDQVGQPIASHVCHLYDNCGDWGFEGLSSTEKKT